MTDPEPVADAANGRTNQKARTRAALLRAAMELVREGRPPSMPEAAERALISPATAYRYFPSADDLWDEASQSIAYLAPRLRDAEERVEAVGEDPFERLDAMVRSAGFLMVDEQAPFRRLALRALERWFDQQGEPAHDQVPNRERRRKHLIATVIAPLRGTMPDPDLDRLAHALGVVIGTDVMIALVDGVGLEGDDAKAAMLDASRWLLHGALAELRPDLEPAPSAAGGADHSG